MKRLALALAILAMAVSVMADPSIVSDPDSEALRYRMRLSLDNGATWGTWVEGPPVAQAMKFDISGTARGDYKGEAEAAGETKVVDIATGAVSTVIQWSNAAPFSLAVKPGKTPTGIKAVTD